MTKISLTLPPPTNATYRHVGHTVYMTREAKAWRDESTWLLKAHRGDKPTELTITLYLKRERDVDGSSKLVIDCLEHAGVVENDKDILDIHLHKRWDKANPRLEIEWQTGH